MSFKGEYMLELKTFNDLINIKPNNNYYLSGDIDCAGQVLEKPICDFVGEINGNGYTIKNLVIKQEIYREEQPVTLFYSLYKTTIKNLCIENLQFQGLNSVYSLHVCAVADVIEYSCLHDIKIEIISENDTPIPLAITYNNCDIENVLVTCNGKEIKV